MITTSAAAKPRAFAAWAGTDPEERPESYERRKAQLTDHMLSNLEFLVPGLRDKLVFCELGTPLTNRFYCASHEGNLYGTEKVLSQLGPFGYQLKTPIPGLFHCGASTLGHGVAGAMMSGLGVAARVLEVPRTTLIEEPGAAMRIYPSEHPEQWPRTKRPRCNAAAAE